MGRVTFIDEDAEEVYESRHKKITSVLTAMDEYRVALPEEGCWPDELLDRRPASIEGMEIVVTTDETRSGVVTHAEPIYVTMSTIR